MERLSNDILLMILEQLWTEWHIWGSFIVIPPLRLVSRRWDPLATPLVFRHIKLNSKIINSSRLDRDSNRTRRRCWAHMRAHTTHVTIPRSERWGTVPMLNWNCAIGLLGKCRRLQYLKYQFSGGEPRVFQQALPAPLRDALKHKLRNLKLLISLWPFEEVDKLIPVHQLFDLSVSTSWYSRVRDERCQSFIASAKNLQSLSIFCDHGYHFLPYMGRLPAVKELLLENYNWIHMANELPLIFNFSKLDSLYFKPKHRNMMAFLRSLSTDQFPRLRKLTCITISGPPSEENAVQTLSMSTWLSCLKQLEELELRNWMQCSLLKGIAKLGTNLRVLRLKNEWDAPCKYYLTKECLRELGIGCPNIVELEICWDSLPAWDNYKLEELSKFKRLQVLKMEISRLPNSVPADLTFQEAEGVGERVWTFKQGSRLRECHLYKHLPAKHGPDQRQGFIFRFKFKFIMDAAWTSMTFESVRECSCGRRHDENGRIVS